MYIYKLRYSNKYSVSHDVKINNGRMGKKVLHYSGLMHFLGGCKMV